MTGADKFEVVFSKNPPSPLNTGKNDIFTLSSPKKETEIITNNNDSKCLSIVSAN